MTAALSDQQLSSTSSNMLCSSDYTFVPNRAGVQCVLECCNTWLLRVDPSLYAARSVLPVAGTPAGLLATNWDT